MSLTTLTPTPEHSENGARTSRANNELRTLGDHLAKRILGQPHIIPEVAAALQNGELGLTDPKRPKGTFLFLGPTGVGKTELTLAFTEQLFGEDHLIRLDMSEYQTQEALGILLGKGGDDEGLLSKRYTKVQGRGTLLFDEIEKAHPRVLDILLQILDAARITMANGTTLDLAAFYVVCTSNIASHAILDARCSVRSTLVRFVEAQAQAQLRPEVFARFDTVSVFDKLAFEDVVPIAELLLNRELRLHLNQKSIDLTFTPQVPRFLASEGFHSRLGARPLRRTIESRVREVLRDRLLNQTAGLSGLLDIERGSDGTGKLTIRS
jgi:ATP-dependent Clp protease ATP-binding subunit ClpB